MFGARASTAASPAVTVATVAFFGAKKAATFRSANRMVFESVAWLLGKPYRKEKASGFLEVPRRNHTKRV